MVSVPPAAILVPPELAVYQPLKVAVLVSVDVEDTVELSALVVLVKPLTVIFLWGNVMLDNDVAL